MKKRKSNVSQDWIEEEIISPNKIDNFKKQKHALVNGETCSSANKLKTNLKENENKKSDSESENKKNQNEVENSTKDKLDSENDENCDSEKHSGEIDGKEDLNGNREKKRKKGLIYVSNLPKHMNVTLIREYLGQYGDIGRVYLQPDKTSMCRSKKRKNMARHFSEGWIEFLSKRVAKKVAAELNNTQIGTRKKSKFYDSLWCIKYLPSFKWVHLSERIAYEQAVYKKRLMAEISQARKEADFFQQNLDKSDLVKNLEKKNKKRRGKEKT